VKAVLLFGDHRGRVDLLIGYTEMEKAMLGRGDRKDA
jgi:hypothetical protein